MFPQLFALLTLSFLPTSRHFTIIPRTTSLELKQPQPLNLFFFFSSLCAYRRLQGLIQSIEGLALVPQVVRVIIRTPSKRALLAFQQPQTLKNYYSRYSCQLFQSSSPEMLESNFVSVGACCLFAVRLALKAFRALSLSPWSFVDTQSCLLPGFGSSVLLLTQIKNVSALIQCGRIVAQTLLAVMSSAAERMLACSKSQTRKENSFLRRSVFAVFKKKKNYFGSSSSEH